MAAMEETPNHPDSPTSSPSSEGTPSMYRQRNDSEATLVNDLLVLQLAKESKGLDDDVETESTPPARPSMESYNSIAQMNPFADIHPAFRYNGPDVPRRSTSLSSNDSSDGSETSEIPILVLTPPPIPEISQRRPRTSHSSNSKRMSMASVYSNISVRTSITSRDGPRDRYSTRHLLGTSPIDRMIQDLV